MPRLASLELPASVLLMDRDSGKWITLPRGSRPVLELLSVPDIELSPEKMALKDKAMTRIRLQGLGNSVPALREKLTTLILKVTKVCNYRCKYCYDMEPDDELVHLPYEVAMAAIDEALGLAEAKHLKSKPDLLIILHGGEPTLFFPFIKRIVIATRELAQAAGKQVTFVGQTNGSRITRELIEFSSEFRIRWGISCDGPPPLNDNFRVLGDGSGTYRDFERALDRFPEFVQGCNILSHCR